MKYPEDYINKILCGDCLDLMKGIPDKAVDLVMTSPPYNIGKDYGDFKDSMDWDSFIDWNKQIITEMRRISKHIVYVIGTHNNYEYFSRLRPVLEEIKTYKTIIAPRFLYMNPPEICIWIYPDKPSFGTQHKPPMLLNGQVPYVVPVKVGKNEPLHSDHPATFPLRLPLSFIEAMTEKGDTVLDPFFGSGTTGAAAKELGRNFIGIELNPKYIEIAQRRLAQEYLFT